MAAATYSSENVVVTAEGDIVSFAVVTVRYAASANEARDKALDLLDRFCDLRDLVAPATSYSVGPGETGAGSYVVNIAC